jgi:6-phospho-beta-glucosidase
VAGIKLVYIGGGSTRAPGTVASLMERGEHFAGSEIALVDLDPRRLEIVRRLAARMAEARGLDLRIVATTDRAAALPGADVVDAAGASVDAGVAARIRETMPPADLFDTHPGQPR